MKGLQRQWVEKHGHASVDHGTLSDWRCCSIASGGIELLDERPRIPPEGGACSQAGSLGHLALALFLGGLAVRAVAFAGGVARLLALASRF